MRYLICILALVLAVPALAQDSISECPPKVSLSPESDRGLPVSTDSYCVDRVWVSWTLNFTRTEKTAAWTQIEAFIGDEMVTIPVDSRDYTPYGSYQLSGTRAVSLFPDRLRIEAVPGSSAGHFINIVFEATYF
jgi:hypothetical protein